MALLRTKEIRAMDATAREKKLRELRDELMHERGVAAMGGAPPNPGKIRALRKNIARIHTIQAQEGVAGIVPTPASESPAPSRSPQAKPEAPEDETDEELEEDKP
jgi:large subunit ribosomal protein L29